MRAALLVLVALACAGCGGSSPPDPPGGPRVPFAPTPDPDPFYVSPGRLDEPPGTLLKARPITFAPFLGKARANSAWQLQFVSRDARGRPIAAVATVVKPLAPRADAEPLLAYQYAEDSLATGCAPPRSLAGGMANPMSQAEAALVLGLVDAGWALVYPDHQGPVEAYGAGRPAGQITLDAIRAALSFEELGLSPSSRIGLWGYSGGAIPTAWAASMQRAYAPELNIVAVATGGTPADLVGVARNVDASPLANALYFSLIASAVEGINRAYPEMVTPILSERGTAVFEAMKDGCLGDTGDGSPRPTGHFADFVTVQDPFGSEGVRGVEPEITLPFEGDAPTAHTFVFHAAGDALIPVEGVDTMVHAWCAAGAPVAYHRVPGSGHLELALSGQAAARAFLASRLEGSAVDVVPDGTAVCNAP